MKTGRLRLVVAIGALAAVAAILPAGRAVFNGVTDNGANSFASAADFVTDPSFRVVTYEVKTAAGFTGTTHLLTLNQDLVADYFVMMRGAAGDYTSGTDRGPAADYARINKDPFGNFTAGSSAANQLELARGSSTDTWTGQVTVVECILDCAVSGFTLNTVAEITMTTGQTSGSCACGGPWGADNLGQVGLYGGSYGGGMETDETGPANHKTGWARIWPSGVETINLSRSNTGPGAITGTTTFSIYVVSRGAEWTIQRVRVQGSAGGDGMNSTSHYDTATINVVNRLDTWVVAYGEVDDNTLAAGWDGHSFTLGDGVNVNATETSVAVGAEVGAQRDVEVYVHTHPDMFNQYVFGPDGTGVGIISANLSGTPTIENPKSPEVHNANDTAGRRFPLVANTSNGATTLYPRSIVWAQLDANTTARWQRSRSGEPGTYWLQTPDFGDIGSVVVTNPTFRVVTYELTGSGFTGTTYTLTLKQDLVADYFVLMRGAAGNYSSGTDWNPDDNYARVTQDPFGNFTAGSSAANQLELARGAVGNAWTGQVTVVECIADCAASGFSLVRVNEVTMTTGQTSATDTTGGSWGSGNLGQIGLYGGSYGGGVRTTEFEVANHKTAWACIWPSGSDTVNLSRSNTGPGAITGTTEFSVYVVQWGSEWTIQRANVTGSNGGDGMNLTTHYNTASINSVNRADTWVIAYGEVDSNKLDAGWDGHSWTLGDGVNQNTTETLVAVGSEAGVQRDVEVYVHTHPDFFNQYIFGPDGVAPGIVTTATSGTATIQNPTSVETHNANDTEGRRFILVANTQNGAGTAFPRSIVWGQLDGDLLGRWQRSRSGQPGTYWMQTPDFGDIGD